MDNRELLRKFRIFFSVTVKLKLFSGVSILFGHLWEFFSYHREPDENGSLGLRVWLTISTSGNTCYNSSPKKKTYNEFSCILHVWGTRNDTTPPNIAPMNLLILDWATRTCKLLAALPNIFFFSSDDESVVWFMRLSAIRLSARLKPGLSLVLRHL